MDLTTVEGVREWMAGAVSESDWNDCCDKVKKDNGGDYPTWWFREIILSGLYASTSAKWERG